MNPELFEILLGIITLVITGAGGFFVRYINQELGAKKTSEYYEIAKKVVMTIEQLNPDLLGVEKKDLALSKLKSVTKNVISDEQADLLIESAVYEIKKLLKSLNK